MTEKDAQEAFAMLRTVLGLDEGYQLERWCPGDGVARYQITSHSGARQPFGRRYWLGAREAVVAMLAIYYAQLHEHERRAVR